MIKLTCDWGQVIGYLLTLEFLHGNFKRNEKMQPIETQTFDTYSLKAYVYEYLPDPAKRAFFEFDRYSAHEAEKQKHHSGHGINDILATPSHVGGPHLGVVVEHNDKVIGTVCLNHTNPEGGAVITSLYVLPNHRGKGVATEMLKYLLEYCRKKFDSVIVDTWAKAPATKLYERAGLKTVVETRIKYFV